MERREYSAGAVKLSFWFPEFRKAVQLLAAGSSFDEIRRESQEENIFGAPTQRRADQICRTVLTRVQALDGSFYPVFLSGDLAAQKLFALAAVMACDTLFFDFVYEVIREKLIIGSNELEPKSLSANKKCDIIDAKGGGKMEQKSYKSWTISDGLWEAVKDDIPKRQRAEGKEYKRKPGGGKNRCLSGRY